MTASEMEDVLKTLDLRTSRIEHILPTLATKEDLKGFATKEELLAVKNELQEAIQEVDQHAKVMHESLKDDLQMIAGHVAEISQQLPPRSP